MEQHARMQLDESILRTAKNYDTSSIKVRLHDITIYEAQNTWVRQRQSLFFSGYCTHLAGSSSHQPPLGNLHGAAEDIVHIFTRAAPYGNMVNLRAFRSHLFCSVASSHLLLRAIVGHVCSSDCSIDSANWPTNQMTPNLPRSMYHPVLTC